MPTGIGGVQPGRGMSRALRVPSRTSGVPISAVPLGSTIRSAASISSTSIPRSSRLNWENPEVRKAVYKMMNWWMDRGIRRLPVWM